ncbi:MAG: HAMP domain-containing histidine kinase [Bacteroidetes bacterium]|nr:MAG: HAMP domain-containing histidine kinase [Bacteroidota bacterium]
MDLLFINIAYFKPGLNINENTNFNSGLSDAEQRRIKLLQQFNYIAIFSHLLYIVIYLSLDFKLFYPLAINLFVFIIPLIISLKLIDKGKYNAAKIIMTYLEPIPVIFGSILFLGREAGFHFFLLLFSILPMTLWTFNYKRYTISLFLLNVLSFLLIQYVNLDQYSITKLPSEYTLFHAASCYIISFMVVGYVIVWYQIVTDRFENLLKKKSDNLTDVNLQLIEQKEIANEANALLKEKQKHILEQSDALTKINKELEEIVATKVKFFSIIAHDLKNPLGALMGFSEILYADYAQFDDKEKSMMAEEIFKSTKRAYNLLDNLLIWSKLQTTGIKPNPEKINLNSLIHETCRLLENMRTNKNIDLDLSIGMSQEVYADKYMLSSVVNNLFSNAIKFTPVGGIITISSELIENEYIKICISDNGMGISQDDISRLFRIDQNISTRGTNNEKGTGLGLSLCKEFVERNGGKIWVESERNKGSHFFFTVSTNWPK